MIKKIISLDSLPDSGGYVLHDPYGIDEIFTEILQIAKPSLKLFCTERKIQVAAEIARDNQLKIFTTNLAHILRDVETDIEMYFIVIPYKNMSSYYHFMDIFTGKVENSSDNVAECTQEQTLLAMRGWKLINEDVNGYGRRHTPYFKQDEINKKHKHKIDLILKSLSDENSVPAFLRTCYCDPAEHYAY